MTAAHPTSKHTQPAPCVGARPRRSRARTGSIVRRQPNDDEDVQGCRNRGGTIIGPKRVPVGQTVVVDLDMQLLLDPCRRSYNPDARFGDHVRHGEADAPCPRRYGDGSPSRALTTRAVDGDGKTEHILRIMGATQDRRVVGDHIVDALRENTQGNRCWPGHRYTSTGLRRDSRAPERWTHNQDNRGRDKRASLHTETMSSLFLLHRNMHPLLEASPRHGMRVGAKELSWANWYNREPVNPTGGNRAQDRCWAPWRMRATTTVSSSRT